MRNARAMQTILAHQRPNCQLHNWYKMRHDPNRFKTASRRKDGVFSVDSYSLMGDPDTLMSSGLNI
jgi:hypothetical protein